MITQPYVVRLFVNSEDEARTALSQLGNQDIHGDYLRSAHNEPAKWKIIFTHLDPKSASVAVRALKVQPRQVDIWNPTSKWEETGDQGFKQLQ